MNVNISLTETGEIKFSMGSERVRKDNLEKWLGRNDDAVLVKLEGQKEPTAPCSVGHICRIEKADGDQKYNVLIGKHVIGQLPDRAIEFANNIEYSPEFLISIVGKVEDDGIFIYIAE